MSRKGPLAGLRIVEIAGLGPGPMAAMLLADLGATVVRVERKVKVELGLSRPRKYDLLLRNREVIGVDLKDPRAIELVLDLVEGADGLIEGFRPGVMERLGLGPDVCLRHNPALVYGRVTGWGQTGPLAQAAGHDLNYIALTGAVAAIGRNGAAPAVPLNLVGDFGGGALYLALGMVSGILSARGSGQGQVVDAAMVDGAASLQTMFFGLHAAGIWNEGRGTNPIDSGSHFYDVYECADGRWVSVAALESRFHDTLMAALGIDLADIGNPRDPANWPRAKERVAARFREQPQSYWCERLEGTDACFAPVLNWSDAARHPHMQARQTLIEIDGVLQPAVAPRFSATPPEIPKPPAEGVTAEATIKTLADWLPAETIERYRVAGLFD